MEVELILREPTPCYRAYMELDLSHTASLVYRSSNNMVPAFTGPNWACTNGYDVIYPSQDVIIAGDQLNSRYILLGALTAHRSLTYFELHRSGRNVGISVTQPMIKLGETPEKLIKLEGSDWRELLVEYANKSAAAMGVGAIEPKRNMTGYCTWYYYYAGVTEANFLENLAALKAARNSCFSADVVQIDDGYQTFQGDWLDQDPEWPTPLAEIARRITDAGMTPGLWTMPLLVSTASRVYREHPEWFVRNADGKPQIMPGWSPPPDDEWVCLDATNEEVLEHLRMTYKTFWSWGFRYFKFDGLGFCLPYGGRADKSATPVEAFRRGMMAIREAVPEATILGCGAPFMPVLGIVDNCRVSPDTARNWLNPDSETDQPLNADPIPGWLGMASAYHATLGNWWMVDRWFRADPDVIMARQDNSNATLGEARLSAAGGILTGVAITSDHLGTIAPDRLALLGRTARYRLKEARPHNWVCNRWPYAFTGTVDGKKAALLLNDSNEPITFKFAELGLSASCRELLQEAGEVVDSFTLAPHDAALITE